jgi:hypothetical protein
MRYTIYYTDICDTYIYMYHIIWCIIKEVVKKVFRGDSLEQFNFWTLSDEGFRCEGGKY